MKKLSIGLLLATHQQALTACGGEKLQRLLIKGPGTCNPVSTPEFLPDPDTTITRTCLAWSA